MKQVANFFFDWCFKYKIKFVCFNLQCCFIQSDEFDKCISETAAIMSIYDLVNFLILTISLNNKSGWHGGYWVHVAEPAKLIVSFFFIAKCLEIKFEQLTCTNIAQWNLSKPKTE